MGNKHTEIPSPCIATVIDFVDQAKPARFESAGASALHTLPFGFNRGDVTRTQGLGVWSAHYHSFGNLVGQYVHYLLPSPGEPTL